MGNFEGILYRKLHFSVFNVDNNVWEQKRSNPVKREQKLPWKEIGFQHCSQGWGLPKISFSFGKFHFSLSFSKSSLVKNF